MENPKPTVTPPEPDPGEPPGPRPLSVLLETVDAKSALGALGALTELTVAIFDPDGERVAVLGGPADCTPPSPSALAAAIERLGGACGGPGTETTAVVRCGAESVAWLRPVDVAGHRRGWLLVGPVRGDPQGGALPSPTSTEPEAPSSARAGLVLDALAGLVRAEVVAALERSRREEEAARAWSAEKALDDERHLRAGLLDSFSWPVCYKDVEGKILGCNVAYAALIGRDREAIVGRHCADVLPADEAAQEEDADRRVLERDGVCVTEEARLGDDGEPAHYIVERAVLLRADCSIGGLVHTMVDITARKRGEEAVARSEERLAQLIQQTPLAVVEWNERFEVVVWNAAAERIFGYRFDEVAGRRVAELIMPPAARGRFEGAWAELLSTGAGRRSRAEHVTKDGRSIVCDWHNVPLLDPEGRIAGVISIVEDITQRVAADAALAESEVRLRHAQKMEAVGRLAGGVAHDFNNLLQVILAGGALLRSHLRTGAALHGEVAEIVKAAKRAAGLTRQLLAFSRQQALVPRVLDLNAIVSDLERMLSRLLGEDVALVTFLDPALALVRADPSQVEQVIVNLAVNARDAMRGGGRLSISTRNVDGRAGLEGRGLAGGRYVELAVMDTGHGMDAETQSRIFEPFFTTKERGKGTGLGLSTVFGIVEQTGGHIHVESAIGSGSTFFVYLPALGEEATLAPLEVEATAPRGCGESILVVEDDDAVRAVVCTILREGGYGVLDSPNGPAALEVARRHDGPIALLLTDVVMPAMAGPEVWARLRRERPDVRLLLMSGHTGDLLEGHTNGNPERALLHKPFTPEGLYARVREVLDGAAPRREEDA